MDDLLSNLSEALADPVERWYVVAGGIVIMGLLFFIVGKARGKGPGKTHPKVKRLLAAGKVEAAANFELKRGNLQQALDYFLHAQKPLRAAQVAQRMDKQRQAAELYKKAGKPELAAQAYRLAGMERRATELGSRGRARAGQFTWQTAAAGHLQVYCGV